MAKSYDIPPNTSEEEKAIGGVLTFAQFFWLLGGVLLGVGTYFVVYLVTRTQIISIPLTLIVACSGLPFAFRKKHEMKYYNYLITKRQFNKKTKKLINRRNV